MAANIPDAIRGDLDVVEGTDWRARLLEASYRSPSGKVIAFDYENVRRSVELRGSAYSFPGVNEQFIQRTGYASRVYPMRCFFSGEQHDLAATAFEAALLESGRGRLTHPLYGTFDVVPFGSVTRRDDLVSAANQSIVEVTFWTSLPSEYPGFRLDPRNELEIAIADFDGAAAAQFADSVALAGAAEQANTKATVTDLLASAESALLGVSQATASARASFEEQRVLLNRGIDVLIGDPLLLARQIVALVKAPARAAVGIRSRLAGYVDFAQGIYASARANEPVNPVIGVVAIGLTASLYARARNNVHTSDLFASSAVASSALAALETEFTTKPEAIAAAVAIAAQFDAWAAWRDSAFPGAGVVDTGASYQAVKRVASLVAGYLVGVSFSLVPERVIVLDRARTVVDLCAQLYGRVDNDSLDFLIATNDLTGAEILELPAGRSIAYYVVS